MKTLNLNAIRRNSLHKLKSSLLPGAMLFFFILQSNVAQAQSADETLEQDRDMIFEALDNFVKGWMAKDASLLANDYAYNIQWVNPEGKMVYTKDKLQAYFEASFAANPDFSPPFPSLSHQITYLDEKMGIVQSMETAKGVKKFHLRVFYKEGNAWKIMNHMTSKSHPY